MNVLPENSSVGTLCRYTIQATIVMFNLHYVYSVILITIKVNLQVRNILLSNVVICKFVKWIDDIYALQAT